MPGEVVAFDAAVCRGWATIPGLASYGATVHLVLDDAVRASAIADGKRQDGDAADIEGDCWFSLDLSRVPHERRGRCRLFIGESGEALGDRTQDGFARVPRSSRSPAPPRPVTTYRDCLAYGLTANDIIDLMYVDVLRRPADAVGAAMKIRALESGRETFDTIRKSLLESQEYRNLTLRARDAPGWTFGRAIARQSSSRRQSIERRLGAFLRSDLPLRITLLRFFPGLVAIDGAVESLERNAENGVPPREIFCRALGRLSQRPALILPDVVDRSHLESGECEPDEAGHLHVPSSSPLFAMGWSKMESVEANPYRWMEQIGAIGNPLPQRPVETIEIAIEGWYGALDRKVAAVSDRCLLATSLRQQERGGWRLSVTADGAEPFDLSYVALVAADATCPYHQDGTPDPRLLSCRVNHATFNFVTDAS